MCKLFSQNLGQIKQSLLNAGFCEVIFGFSEGTKSEKGKF